MYNASVENPVLCLVSQSSPTFTTSMGCTLPGSSVPGKSPGKKTGISCHALLQGIFQTQGLNPGLPHCRWILYPLGHQGSPRILEWVVYPFSPGYFYSGIKPGSPALQTDSFPAELPGKPLEKTIKYKFPTLPLLCIHFKINCYLTGLPVDSYIFSSLGYHKKC